MTRPQSALHPYQRLGIDHLLDHPRANLWADMGMGKTATVLTAFETARMLGNARRMLVLAPLRVAEQVWPGEPQEWAHLRHLRVKPLTGSRRLRGALAMEDADIYTINYENLPWLVEFWGKKWPYDWVVADESTRLRKPSGKRFLAARKVHKLPLRWTNMTGTPTPNGLHQLWAQQYLVDSGERLGAAYTNSKHGVGFTTRWFQPNASGFGIEPQDGAEDEIYAAISDVTLSLRAEDYLDPHDAQTQTIAVDLPPAARRVYNDMEKKMLAELSDIREVTAVNAGAKTMKLRQIASGAVYYDDAMNWERVHDAKLDALESVIEEAGGEPILVAYTFRSSAARILKRFKGARPLDKKPATVTDWNAGRIPLLLAHPASCGHGLSLQHGGRRIVFFDQDWDAELYAQVLERLGPVRQLQSGYDRLVYVYHLVARGTLDPDVMAARSGKITAQDALRLAMRRQS